MAHLKIGAKLKEYRLRNNWTVDDVVNELSRRYDIHVSDKTVYGWESDQAYPRTPTFLVLCEMYHIEKPYEVFSAAVLPPNDFAITPAERELLYKLRKHPELLEVVHRVLDV